jgi:hypothetical protein
MSGSRAVSLIRSDARIRDAEASVGEERRLSMVKEMPIKERDELPTSGRESAICELTCRNCGDGLRFDQRQCETCGEINPRFRG